MNSTCIDIGRSQQSYFCTAVKPPLLGRYAWQNRPRPRHSEHGFETGSVDIWGGSEESRILIAKQTLTIQTVRRGECIELEWVCSSLLFLVQSLTWELGDRFPDVGIWRKYLQMDALVAAVGVLNPLQGERVIGLQSRALKVASSFHWSEYVSHCRFLFTAWEWELGYGSPDPGIWRPRRYLQD